MAIFVTQAEIARLKAAPEGSRQSNLYQAMRARTMRNTRAPGLVQPEDTQEWWHLCWERAADAAFVWHVEQPEALGVWLRDVGLWLARLDADAWIGPWFRGRETPLVGMLETAHATIALCNIIDLAAPLFSRDELEEMRAAVHDKGMLPCMRFCERVQERGTHINNWYCVLLGGFGTAAVTLGDVETIEKAIKWLPAAWSLYNDDSYGESVQYSNYASLTLAHLQEVLLRGQPECAPLLQYPYATLMPWYAASFLHMKPLAEGETVYPRTFNFADSSALFRPTGDVLAQVSARLAAKYPREAALASWLFETTYADPDIGPDELATFGFFNQFSYHSVLMQPDMAEAASPEALGYGESIGFSNGHVIWRDRVSSPRAAMAIQAGYAPMNVTSHRHQDHLSFQLAQGMERMFIDGGHCCYRLASWRFATSSAQHNVFDFVREDGSVIGQKMAEGNFFVRKDPLVRNEKLMRIGSAQVLVADASDAYPAPILSAKRAFVSVLPGAVFIIDAATALEPVRMRSHFALNNRDGALGVNRATDHKFVFRRHGEAAKLFESAAFLDGARQPSTLRLDWGYAHDYYHPLPNQAGQAKEGSALIYSWDSPRAGQTHLRVYAIAMDRDPAIRGWHILETEPMMFTIESPEKQPVLRVRVSPAGRVFLIDDQGETPLL